jgi:HSP20 family protein
MKLPSLWSGSQDLMSDPFRSIRREMEDMFRKFDQGLPSLRVGAGMPAINVAETKDALEVTIEVPGVEEKDINVTLDGNQLVISGEKKEETKKDEKDWHVVERSYGSFYRSMSLPFKPGEGAVEAHLDKGVLHLNIKKPAEVAKNVKTIEIKPTAPTKAAG